MIIYQEAVTTGRSTKAWKGVGLTIVHSKLLAVKAESLNSFVDVKKAGTCQGLALTGLPLAKIS